MTSSWAADVNGDGFADVVGFANDGVHVSLASGRVNPPPEEAFNATGFANPETWSTGYDVADGWRVAENPRLLANIDSAPGADIVGFADDGLHVTSLAIHIEPPKTP